MDFVNIEKVIYIHHQDCENVNVTMAGNQERAFPFA